jgi:hypothetical protein
MSKLRCVLCALFMFAAIDASHCAELNNSGAGQWSETDASNVSPPPDGWPAGMLPSQVEPAARAEMGAVKRFWDRLNCTVTATGASNAYVYTPANTAYPTAYVAGETYCFKAGFTNSGAATININGLGAKNIYKASAGGPVALTGGEIATGNLAAISYDGTEFQILNANTAGSSLYWDVFLNSSQSMSSNLPAKIQLNAATSDPNGWLNTSNFRVQPTVPGTYAVFGTSQISLSSGDSEIDLWLYRDGGPYEKAVEAQPIPTGGIVNPVVGGLVYFNGTSDYVELYFDSEIATTITAQGAAGAPYLTHMWGYRIAP